MLRGCFQAMITGMLITALALFLVGTVIMLKG